MITVGPWAAGQIVRSRRRLAEQLRVRNDELLAQQQAYAAEAVRYERSGSRPTRMTWWVTR